jgi:hypothetical protein
MGNASPLQRSSLQLKEKNPTSGTHTHTYTHTCTCASTHASTCARTHASTRARTHARVHTRTHTHTHRDSVRPPTKVSLSIPRALLGTFPHGGHPASRELKAPCPILVVITASRLDCHTPTEYTFTKVADDGHYYDCRYIARIRLVS